MKTWSLAGVMDVLKHVERITRPPRRPDGAEQLAEREAAEEVSEPGPYSIEELFRENHRNWAARIPAEVKSWTCIGCGEKWYDEDHDHDCPSLAESEPPLTNDELVGVRGLLQERYEDDRRPKWLRDIEVGSREQAAAILRGDPPPCEHRYCARQGYAMCFGVTGAQMDIIEDTRPNTSASAGAEPNSPADLSPAGDSPAGVDSFPQSPPAGRSRYDELGGGPW